MGHISSVRVKHQQRASRFKELLRAVRIPFIDSESHIVPVMVNDAAKCKAVSDMLLEKHGMYLQPINYPTVPVGTERLRFTPGPLHTPEMMERAVAALDDVWVALRLPRESKKQL